MNSHGNDGLDLYLDHGKDISPSRSFMTQAEESIVEVSLQNKGQEIDEKTCLENQQETREEFCADLSRASAEAIAEKRDSRCPNMAETEELNPDSLPEKASHTISENCIVQCDQMLNPAEIVDALPRPAGGSNTEEGDPVIQQVSRNKESDSSLIARNEKIISVLEPKISHMKTSETLLHKTATDNDHYGDSGTRICKEGRYFYYDTPLYEETGSWIPVSVPPLSESEHEEWTRGLGSNGGYIPEEDMGWSQCLGENKELTMWDVVSEMILVARGKVSALASGDIEQVSWISTHLMEQAWNDMAQTLTETTFSNTQEILESEPPKWLPDSAASSCMLCSVRFHPIMCTRHHCRFCGGVFCSDCTKGRSLLPEKFRTGDPQRVCDVCYVRLESVQLYLRNQVSCAAQLPTHDLTDLSTLRSWVNFPWGQTMEYEIYKATNTIRGYSKVGSLRAEKRIPMAILQDAKGLAILTVVKVGMVVTYNIGTGLVVARREDGSWSPPSAISSFGVGWGAQAGGELIDFIIVLRTNDAVNTFCSDSHLSLGAGLSAALGITGRTAEADMRAGPSGFAACYTYSCSKGAFIGCSLEGSVVTTRTRENSRFYGSQSITASEILLGSQTRPPAAATLYRALDDLFLQLEL